MRRRFYLTGVAVLGIVLLSCEGLFINIDGEFDHSDDPGSEEYQGFETVDDPDEV